MWRGVRHLGLVTAGALALAGCDPLATSPRPEARGSLPAPVAVPERPQPSARSVELAEYYRAVQANLLTQGLLRKDGGGPDTPFSQRDLVENFIQTALIGEFTFANGRFVDTSSEQGLRRWRKPIRLGLDFGDSVTDMARADTTATVTRYLARLSRITDHPITLARENPNFLVAVLTIDEIESYGPDLRAFNPDISPEFSAQILTLDRLTDCIVYTFEDDDPRYETKGAVSIIRAEHPKLLRDKCLHEEIAQGLGLTNDSPAARPSIFNDDDEFALLTRHDELLLQMLYDARLTPGMRPDAARPVLEVIASERLGGES